MQLQGVRVTRGGGPAAPPASPYDGRKLALVVLGGGAFIASLGLSVVNVVLADLTDALGATTADLQWIVNGFTLVFAVCVMGASAAGDRYGARRVFRVGLVVCLVGAFAAAFSPTTTALIAGRGIMGLGTAIITPSSLAIITELFASPKDRAFAFGVWAGVGSLGLALGPIIGGALLQRYWWGAAFLVNAPALLVLLGATWLVLPASPPPTDARMDWQGALLATAGLGPIVWAVIQGPVSGWTAPAVLGGVGVGVLFLLAFVAWEGRADSPMLNLTYVRRRAVAMPLLTTAAVSFALAGLLLGVSLLYRTVFHYSPFATGLALMPLAVAMAIASALGPRLAGRVGIDLAIATSTALVALGAGLLAFTDPAHGPAIALLGTAILGSGFGLGNAPSTASVVGAFPPGRAGVGSGLPSTIRQVGFLLGVATLGSILSTVYRSDVSTGADAAGLGASDVEATKQSVGGALRVSSALGGSAGRTLRQAAVDAFAHGFRMAAVGAAVVGGVATVLTLLPTPKRAKVVERPPATLVVALVPEVMPAATDLV
ncbi:MAG: putative transporter [Actinomycetia bacterium]|nr:putative transporter [Actinomycetes bacterium]